VQDAISRWNDVAAQTSVSMVPHAGKPEDDHLVFTLGHQCSSQVGRRGGPQEITVTRRVRLGAVMHEIGHAIGLRHEHSRPDRDSHVKIMWENVLPIAHYNFISHADEPDGDYDTGSIMHYSRLAFSRNRWPTVVPVEGDTVEIGQRRALSQGDIARVARLYEGAGS
jgi:astacin